MAGAPYTAALSHHFYRVPWDRVFLVKLYVQRAPFTEGDPASRQLAICYMPRKMAAHTHAVRRAVEASEPGVPWVEIDGVSESAVARRLQSSAVFFSTQNREGFGLPALEAMATGTLVAGYAGTFPFRHPYATRANGVWAADRRGGAAAAVLKAIRVARSGGPEYHEMIAQGHRTAAGYSKGESLNSLARVLEFLDRGDEAVPRGVNYPYSFLEKLSSVYILLRRRRLVASDLAAFAR